MGLPEGLALRLIAMRRKNQLLNGVAKTLRPATLPLWASVSLAVK